MTFSDAVRDGFSKYVVFSGRSSRPAYWWWYLFTIIAYIVAAIIDQIIGTFVITVILALALLLPNLAVTVRRLHDAGHSGWWILIGLIPIIGKAFKINDYVAYYIELDLPVFAHSTGDVTFTTFFQTGFGF